MFNMRWLVILCPVLLSGCIGIQTSSSPIPLLPGAPSASAHPKHKLVKKAAPVLTSGIRGKIIASDTSPISDLYPGDPMPFATVIIYHYEGEKKTELPRVKADRNGLFGLRVPPGEYGVKAAPREENTHFKNREVKVNVLPNQFVWATTNYDCGY